MSRLDDHVSAVRNRMALILFTIALAWLSAGFATVVWLAVLVDRIFLLHLPQPVLWFYGGVGAMLAAAIGYAMFKRPGPREAAVPIDVKLGLKEKISTALYIRSSDDPFAQAAVRDAEETARGVVVNMGQHFPIPFPRPAYATIVIALLAGLSYAMIDPMNLFDRREKAKQQEQRQADVAKATKQLQNALATVSAIPPSLENAEAIRLAKADLQAMLNAPINDPGKANRTAVKVLQDVNEAIKQQIKSSAKYAEAQNEAKMFRSMQKPIEGQGPVSDAHRAIAEGKFMEAVDDLEKAVENFDKMDKADQAKAAQQMQQMAQQLQQMANNPAEQKKMQQQLQQMGMNQQQAQQAQQLMQQAAQGDKQAQQQLQQMAQQQAQQMNNGQGPNPQQQQQMQQMMQQMQAQANAQQQAQQMGQAAQQMAQAMQQAAQQGAQQGAQQQGQQNQPMGQAMNQMQQQIQQMQAMAQDAQQIAAAQAAAQNAAAQAQGGAGNAGNKPGQGGNGMANWNPNANLNGQNQNQQWNGQGAFAGPNQGGVGAGDRTYKEQAPYSVKPEMSPSQDDEKGRILASSYIKDSNPLKGSSSQSLKDVAESALKDQTDEIDQVRVSRQAQKAVEEYFRSMSKEGN